MTTLFEAAQAVLRSQIRDLTEINIDSASVHTIYQATLLSVIRKQEVFPDELFESLSSRDTSFWYDKGRPYNQTDNLYDLRELPAMLFKLGLETDFNRWSNLVKKIEQETPD